MLLQEDDLKRCTDTGDNQGRALWNLFAQVKYHAAKSGPRQPGRRPDELKQAAEVLRQALELCWRSGYKGEDLADALLRMVKSRPQGA